MLVLVVCWFHASYPPALDAAASPLTSPATIPRPHHRTTIQYTTHTADVDRLSVRPRCPAASIQLPAVLLACSATAQCFTRAERVNRAFDPGSALACTFPRL